MCSTWTGQNALVSQSSRTHLSFSLNETVFADLQWFSSLLARARVLLNLSVFFVFFSVFSELDLNFFFSLFFCKWRSAVAETLGV